MLAFADRLHDLADVDAVAFLVHDEMDHFCLPADGTATVLRRRPASQLYDMDDLYVSLTAP